MIAVSDTWKELHRRFLLPETFVEISCGFTDIGVRDVAEATGSDEAVFSNVSSALSSDRNLETAKYATLEHNLWVLDGSRNILPDSGPYNAPGYASNGALPASVVLTVPEPRETPIPGFTITWSSEYGEYPTSFRVVAKNGNTEIASATVENNTSSMTEVALDIVNYDSVTVEVLAWNLPDHRVRIDQISFGHMVSFNKNDILSFSHEQQGCLVSGELPKNSINFALDNTDGKWNPNNPDGIGKYLVERQLVTVRYGMSVDGATEWIKAGTFYLSEWKTPANGLEASFAARDIFEYMMNVPYVGATTGTLAQLVAASFSSAGVPDGFEAQIDGSLGSYSATISDTYTAAEIVQMCANAAGCVMYQDRDGKLHIEPFSAKHSGYTIPSELSYSHPEMTLSKPLKSVSVSYSGDQTYLLNVGMSGETQTVSNPLVSSETQAAMVAERVYSALETRKTVDGEFRADPRLDAFDVVSVESKYGTVGFVAITNVKYSYSGSFKASYTGRVINVAETSALGHFVLGTSKIGQGV